MPGNMALIIEFMKKKGLFSSEFVLIILVLSGVDLDTATAIMAGGVTNVDELRLVVSSIHDQTWQELAVKAALAGLYTWYRRDIKKLGLEVEIERLRAGK